MSRSASLDDEPGGRPGGPPAPDEVQIWTFGLDLPPWRAEAWSALSDAERQRAVSTTSASARDRFIIGRAALRSILAGLCGGAPAALPILRTREGRPVLDGSDLSFNLSHCEDVAMLVVARRRAVGVDVERIRPLRDIEALMQTSLARSEVGALRALRGRARQEAFFRTWTRKEAYLKACGAALAVDPATFSVPAEDRPQTTWRPRPGQAPWTILQLTLPDAFTGAVVAEGTGLSWTRRWWHPRRGGALGDP